MKKITKFIICFIILFNFSIIKAQEAGKTFSLTETEKRSMLNEADDYIDDLPEGSQDHEADAIYHAMKGITGELINLRNLRNGKVEIPSDINVKIINELYNSRNIKLKLYQQKESKTNQPLYIFIHGGGWIKGGFESGEDFCVRLAQNGITVIALDYSLSPENQYPEALLDCLSSINYSIANISKWTCNKEKIIIGGEDAGGNLALSSLLYLIKNNQNPGMIKGIVLYYPLLKTISDKTDSWKKYGRGYGLDSRLAEAYYEAYQESSTESMSGVSNQQTSVDFNLGASLELPPMLILNGSRDIIVDQCDELAENYKKSGVTVYDILLEGAIHNFLSDNSQATALKKAVEFTAKFIKEL